jgi:hypothetical protein
MSARSRIFFAATTAGVLLASCTTPTRFEWGAYEGALYGYAKKPELRQNYRASLEKAIAQGRKTNRLAPGLLAELGYLALEDHDEAQAVRLFEEEMQAFPESRPFLSSVVARVKGQADTTKAVS